MLPETGFGFANIVLFPGKVIIETNGKKWVKSLTSRWPNKWKLKDGGLSDVSKGTKITLILELDKKDDETTSAPNSIKTPTGNEPGRAQPAKEDLIGILRLAYPPAQILPIIREFENLFRSIDFANLKEEIDSAGQDQGGQSSTQAFLRCLRNLLEGKGYFNYTEPLPLIKLLSSALNHQDIFEIIDGFDESELSLEDKKG